MKTETEIKLKLEQLDLPVDDLLMQYVAMLMSNQKSPGEIQSELVNLLGDSSNAADLEPKITEFTNWLFDQSTVMAAQPPFAESMAPEDAGSPELDVVMPTEKDHEMVAKALESRKNASKIPAKPAVVQPSFTVTLDGKAQELKQPEEGNPASKLIMPDEIAQIEKKRLRCRFWPACGKGELCEFIHPKELCIKFPKCPFGNECLFIHPATAKTIVPCKFGLGCTNASCTFQHPTKLKQRTGRSKFTAGHAPYQKSAKAQQQSMCLNGADCVDPQCTLSHPSTVDCYYGENCTNASCRFKHPLSRPLPDATMKKTIPVPCRYGDGCKNPKCHFSHDSSKHTSERSYTVEEPVSSISEFASSSADAQNSMEISN